MFYERRKTKKNLVINAKAAGVPRVMSEKKPRRRVIDCEGMKRKDDPYNPPPEVGLRKCEESREESEVGSDPDQEATPCRPIEDLEPIDHIGQLYLSPGSKVQRSKTLKRCGSARRIRKKKK